MDDQGGVVVQGKEQLMKGAVARDGNSSGGRGPVTTWRRSVSTAPFPLLHRNGRLERALRARLAAWTGRAGAP